MSSIADKIRAAEAAAAHARLTRNDKALARAHRALAEALAESTANVESVPAMKASRDRREEGSR